MTDARPITARHCRSHHAVVRRAGRRGQGAQTLVAFALSFALFLVALVFVVVDVAVVFVESNRAQGVAQSAAQQGAQIINFDALYSTGAVQVDVDGVSGIRAADACANAVSLALAGQPALNSTPCVATPNRVTATVSISVSLPFPLPGKSVTVAASSDAAPASGALTPVP